jgi:hypothetical protein
MGFWRVRRVDCLFLLPYAIQSLGLYGVCLIHRVEEDAPAEMMMGPPAWRATLLHTSRKPVENGIIESFNGRLRDECLNVEWFSSLHDVREKLARWRLGAPSCGLDDSFVDSTCRANSQRSSTGALSD